MNFDRRKFLLGATAGVATAAGTLPKIVRALDYPVRSVRLIVPVAAGGGADIVARLIGQWLSERLGQQFIVENRAGGGTNIGTEFVAHSPPDGYTLLLVNSTHAVNASLYEKLNYNFIRDIAPVGTIIGVSNVVEIHPSVPAKTMPEFIAYAKANPGRINMGSAGNGSSSHMAGELFNMLADVKLTHVPYRGQGPAMTDLLGGQLQVIFATTPGTTEYVRTGRLRALAVTTATRAAALPEVPPLKEFVSEYESSQWYGIAAPKETPGEIVGKLNREINAALVDSRMAARFADIGGSVLPGSPADFAKLVADDTVKWGKVVKFAGLRAD
jgi:tripartite-type tricarboxylate transporter receptor subunit TctC